MNQERYSRLKILPSIGLKGIDAISKAKVGILGLGGLGSWSSLLLTQMGIGFLRIIDRDVVEISNLARTPIYNSDSVDLPKAEQAALFLRKLNPDVVIEEKSSNIDENSIDELINGLDLVIDGLDNVSTRLIVNKACKKLKIPLVFAGAIGTSANLSTFSYTRQDQACLNCFLQNIADNDLETCDITGVHTALLSIVASIQVNEAIKIITHTEPVLQSKLSFIYLETLDFDFVPLKQSKTCVICFPPTLPRKQKESSIIELCGDRTFLIPKKDQKKLVLSEIVSNLIRKNIEITKQGSLGLTFTYIFESRPLIVSIFSNGNILIRGEAQKEKVFVVYNEIIKTLL